MNARTLCLASLLLTTTAVAQHLSDVNIRSNSVVKKTSSGNRQVVTADVTSDGPAAGVVLEMRIPGLANPIVVRPGALVKGKNRLLAEIPPVKTCSAGQVRLTAQGKVLYAGKVDLRPPRKWKVFDVQVSHHDLGYADYYHLMRRDVREMGLEMALEYCRRTDSWEKNAQFHWTVETSEPMTKFISSRPRAVLEELAKRIREGRIELGGLHNSVYTEMMGYESMARLFYTPNRTICDLLDIPPSRTALISDVVGFARTLPLYLKEAGVPYFYHGYNETVDGLSPASAEPVFFWRATDGDTSAMPLVRSFPYYSPDRLTKYDLNEISGLLERYEANPRWTARSLVAEDSYDFSLPHFENVEGIRRWNERYANPVIVSATFSMFFDALLKETGRRTINVYDQDAPNAWADEDGSDGKLMGDARLLNFELPSVEKLSTLAFASGGKGYPWLEIWQAYHKLLSYHEHTDGAFSEEDVLPIPFQRDRKAANANYYECEQVMHKALIREAEAFADSARAHAVNQFRHLISTDQDGTVVVFNTLNELRSGVALLETVRGADSVFVDNVSGDTVLSQIMPGGRVMVFASDVPSMGYRTYRRVAGRPGRSDLPGLFADSGVLENEYYRIQMDDSSGAISSIWDKERKVELVDRQAEYRFGEYIYQRIDEPFSRTPTAYHPRRTLRRFFAGPLAAGITTRIRGEGVEWAEQTVMLTRGSRTIDFTVELDKSESGRMLKQATGQNKEALFYALPFNIPGFTIHHELPGGVVEPLAHQFRGSTSNYFGIQHFSDLSNGRYGVTLSSINAPLVEYGSPRPALWLAPSDMESIIRKPEKSHVYLYLMNNMFFTNIPLSQPGRATFRWSIRAHDGDWVAGKAYAFGWETSHPLASFVIEKRGVRLLPAGRHSFLSVDRDNVICSVFKPAEANGRGFILRFFELTGKPSTVRVALNLPANIGSANETNLVETDRDVPIPVEGDNTIRFSISPFGIKTVRVIIETKEQLSPPAVLRARAVSDREIRLAWGSSGKSAVSHYRVYRGTAADFSPALINCVGTVTDTEYTDMPRLRHGGWLDNRLEPNTVYYYRVSAVGHSNDESRASTSVGAKTLTTSERNSVPGKVLGLAATPVSPISSYNYICLLFYTNCEPDVVKYRIYRSEGAGFAPDSSNRLIEIDATQKFTHVTPHGYGSATRELRDYTMMVYPDESARPNRRYYYRVTAVDEGGLEGECSEEVSAISETKRVMFEGDRFFFDSATVDMRPVLDDGSQIRYTTDGSEPGPGSTLYWSPVTITAPTRFRAALFYPGQVISKITGQADFRRSLYPPPRYLQPYSDKWPGQGPLNMVDGAHGHVYFDSYFQGFEFNDMDIVVDLGGKKEISRISVTMLQDIRSWIFLPLSVEFSVSHDGANFEKVGEIETVNENEKKDGSYVKDYALNLDRRSVNFVRVRARNIRMCPPWHIGYELKGKAWVFADEIVVQ
jgi:fibronectin type 3 domain-containing protein